MATHKKLSNEGFIKNAPPEVVERETDQIAKAKAKLVQLEERLEQLK